MDSRYRLNGFTYSSRVLSCKSRHCQFEQRKHVEFTLLDAQKEASLWSFTFQTVQAEKSG